jgi:hypothetical protein
VKALSDTLVAILRSEGAVTGLLSDYPSESGEPAIFMDQAPYRDDADAPDSFIVISAPIGDTIGEVGSKRHSYSGARAREVTLDIRCYAKAGVTLVTLMAAQLLAEAVRDVFHDRRFLVGQQRVTECEVLGPVAAPTSSPDMTGRLMTLRAVIV